MRAATPTCEQVPAGPFAALLARACAELTESEHRVRGFVSEGRNGKTLPDMGRVVSVATVTSRQTLIRRYAERYGTSERTAERHFTQVARQHSIPVVVADRIAALLGVPLAYVEAVS